MTALFLSAAFHCGVQDMYFGPDNTLEWMRMLPDMAAEQMVPGCPLTTKPYEGRYPVQKFIDRESTRPGVQAAVERFGRDALHMLRDATDAKRLYPASQPYARRGTAAAWDHAGRLILCCNYLVHAFWPECPEGVELLDLSNDTFHEMVTPVWAKSWIEPAV